MNTWAVVNAILDRATGGRDVAAKPTDQASDFLPTAGRAAGVTESIEWLRSESALPRLLFLVGGPGAGKSHASSLAIKGLSLQSGAESELADRTYHYTDGNTELLLVNDATISSQSYEVAPLCSEIASTLERKSLLMACVNRGVLIQELAKSGQLESPRAEDARHIARWLAGDSAYLDVLIDPDTDDPVVLTEIDKGYLKYGVLRSGAERLAEIVAVNLDACSLLEITPSVTNQLDEATNSIRPRPTDYRVARLVDRPKMGIESTRAGELLSKTVDAIPIPDEPALATDPIAANLASLRSISVQRGLTTTLRVAEIVSGSTFTFRDLWGTIARCLVGDHADQGQLSYLQLVGDLQPKTVGAMNRFTELRTLAAFRFTQAIFGVGDDSGLSGRPTSNPVTKRTWAVDPVRDSLPGNYDPDSPDHGWSTIIDEAFSGPIDTGSPLETIMNELGEHDPFTSIVQEFDIALDKAYVAALRDTKLKDAQRAEVVSWYGRYVTRLFAVSKGITAFRREAAAWTLAWSMSPTLPTELDNQLRTLVRPPRGTTSPDPAIPVLASRVEPIVGDWSEPKLALTSGTFKLVARASGERLEIQVQESDSGSPWIPLDFALVRQAQSCMAGAIGVTEVADDTSPRLERFRSTQLLAGSGHHSYVVLAGSKTLKIQVGGHE